MTYVVGTKFPIEIQASFETWDEVVEFAKNVAELQREMFRPPTLQVGPLAGTAVPSAWRVPIK